MSRADRDRPKVRARRPRREVKQSALVVTEGTVTEPAYVELLLQELRGDALASVDVKTVPVGKDPLKVVDAARRHLEKARDAGRPYDWCSCLVDVDQHASLADALGRAAAEDIHVVVSNLKFEVWLLWHVDDRRAALTTSELDRRVRDAGVAKGKHLAPSFPVAAYERAEKTARLADPELADRRVGPDPSSAMPFLIELLTHRDEE